ncbi:MAG: hypothetical protein PVS3B3_18840 [Ktedonobacteraceae bacterium]
MNCESCGKYAPECDEAHPWCDACCSTGEIIVDNINDDDEKQEAA